MADMNFGVHVLPKVTTTYNLGSTDKKWNNIYGTLKGNADTATALTSNAGSSSIPIYFTSGKPSAVSNISLVASDTNGKYVEVGNSNGTVKLFASTNRGMYDTTNSKWICYTAQAGDHTYIPLWASKGSSTQPVYFNSSGEPVAAGAYSGLLTALSWTAGTTAGPTLSITVGGTNKTSTIPSASTSASGVVTTGAQTFAGIKTFKSLIQAYRYSVDTAAHSLPFMTFDKPGSYATGIGPDGTNNRIHFGPCPLDGTSWTDTSTFNANEWHFQGQISCTSRITVENAGDTYVWAKNSSTGNKVWLDAGGSANHGIWSDGYYNNSTFTSSGKWIIYRGSDGEAHSGMKLYGAVWNDYAEFRTTKDTIEPGRCVIETGNDDLVLSTKRLQPGAEIVSDTFGFAIGETDEAKTPIATTGRVLAYIYEGREAALAAIGKPVCSGPDGTVSIMTDEEYQKYGYCAIGTISAVPDYEEWGTGNVKVNNRIWIRVR